MICGKTNGTLHRSRFIILRFDKHREKIYKSGIRQTRKVFYSNGLVRLGFQCWMEVFSTSQRRASRVFLISMLFFCSRREDIQWCQRPLSISIWSAIVLHSECVLVRSNTISSDRVYWTFIIFLLSFDSAGNSIWFHRGFVEIWILKQSQHIHSIQESMTCSYHSLSLHFFHLRAFDFIKLALARSSWDFQRVREAKLSGVIIHIAATASEKKTVVMCTIFVHPKKKY